MKKRYIGVLSLVALLAAGCQTQTSSTLTSSTNDSTLSSDTTSTSSPSQSTTSSASAEEKVLSQLQSDPIAFKGVLTEWLRQEGRPEQTIDTPLEVYASGERYYNAERNSKGVVVDVIDYFADDEGYLSEMSLDPYTNTMVEKALGSSSDRFLFADECGNPFLRLTKEDLTVDGAEVSFDLDAELASDLTIFTTYYDDIPMETLTATIDAEGTIESLTLSYEVSATDDPNFGTYERGAKFVFELVDPSTIELPVYQPRPENAETKKLQALFDRMAKGNYTVHTIVTITDEYGPYEDQDLTVTYTEQGILSEDNFYGETTGYFVTEEGVAEVALEEGKLVGQSAVVPAELSEVVELPTFAYHSAMFDVSEDGKTFTLASDLGLNEEAYIMVPDPMTAPAAYPDDGSLKIQFNDDGSYTFIYDETIDFLGMVMVYTYTMVVTDVETTSLGYDESDYVPYTPASSWEDIPGAIDEMEYYGIDPELIPWFCPEGCQWTYSDIYETLALSVGANLDVREVADQFEDVLVEAGWYLVEEDEYGEAYYSYDLPTGDILNISVYPSVVNSEVELFLYDMTPHVEETPLSQWLEENFLGASNYTMRTTVDYVGTPCDQSTGEPTGESTSMTLVETVFQFTDEAAYFQYGGAFADQLYVNKDGHADAYEIVEGEIVSSNTYLDVYQNFLPTLRTLAAPYFAAGEEENQYVPVGRESKEKIHDLLGIVFGEEKDEVGDVVLTLDETKDVLSIDYVINEGYYYVDETEETFEIGYCRVHMEITDVHSTVIDPDILALVAQ